MLDDKLFFLLSKNNTQNSVFYIKISSFCYTSKAHSPLQIAKLRCHTKGCKKQQPVALQNHTDNTLSHPEERKKPLMQIKEKKLEDNVPT